MLTRRSKKAEIVFHWHPNFRVPDALPDIKPVRTGFLINSAAVTFALLALAWMLYVETGIFRAGSAADDLQAQITEKEAKNKEYLTLSSKFMAESRRVQDLTRFYGQALPPLPFLATLVSARPESVLFDAIEVQPQVLEVAQGTTRVRKSAQQIVVTGTLSGSDKTVLYTMFDKIITSPVLKDRIDNPTRDCRVDDQPAGPGVFKFTITILLKPYA